MSENEKLSEREMTRLAATFISLMLKLAGLIVMVIFLGWGTLGVFLFVWGYGGSLMKDIWWPKEKEKPDADFHP